MLRAHRGRQRGGRCSATERHYGGANGAAAAVGEVLRQGGDGATQVSTQGRDGFSPYGQTVWSLAAQERFMASLAAGCAPGTEALKFMGDVVAGSARPGLGGAPSGSGERGRTDGRYLVRQVGVLETATVGGPRSHGRTDGRRELRGRDPRPQRWLAGPPSHRRGRHAADRLLAPLRRSCPRP